MSNNEYIKTIVNVENILVNIQLNGYNEASYNELKNILDSYIQNINTCVGVSEYSSLLLLCYNVSKKVNSKELILLINECNQKLDEFKKMHPECKSKDYYNDVANRVRNFYNPTKITETDNISIECEKWLTNLKHDVDTLQITDVNEYGKLLINISSFEKFFKSKEANLSSDDIIYYTNQINELRHILLKKINQKNSTTRR